MVEMTDEQKRERRNAELSGLLNTKRGLTIFWTSIMCLDVEEAMGKVKLECELRGIPFNQEPVIPEPKKDIWGNIETTFKKGSELVEKFPVIKEVGAPVLKTLLTVGTTAFIGAFAGNKAAETTDNEEVDDNEPIREIQEAPAEVQEESKPEIVK